MAHALRFGPLSAVARMLQHGFDVEHELALDTAGTTGTALHVAVSAANADGATALLAEGADPTARTSTGDSALHVLASVRDRSKWPRGLEAARVLMEQGADAQCRDALGATAADRALRITNTGLAALLHERGGREAGHATALPAMRAKPRARRSTSAVALGTPSPHKAT